MAERRLARRSRRRERDVAGVEWRGESGLGRGGSGDSGEGRELLENEFDVF